MKKKYQNAFSLIELSIVLIIIGLLVAGITGGASLIRSAELRAVMSEIKNYQTGINAYYTATGQMPGETSDLMDFTRSCLAWAKMAEEGIIDVKPSSATETSGSYSCADVTTFTSSNSISSKLKGGLYALGSNTPMNQNVIALVLSDETVANITAAKPKTATQTTAASISRRDAKFLDDKMDNGVIDSGKVQSFYGGAKTCIYDNTAAKDCVTAFGIGL